MRLDQPALERYGTCTLDQEGCLTCADAAVPVRVLGLAEGSAQVEDRLGNRAEVATEFIAGVCPGDILLVHAGVAIALVRETA